MRGKRPFGGEFKAVSGTGRLPSLLRTFDGAARAAGKGDNLPKVAEIKSVQVCERPNVCP